MTRTELRKLLVLRSPALEAEDLLASLRDVFDIQEAGDLESALGAMREDRFQAVLAATCDYLPLERCAAGRQTDHLLDAFGEGVCVVDSHGELVWGNRRICQLPEAARRAITRACSEAYEAMAMQCSKGREARYRACLMPEGGRHFELIASPIFDRKGILRQVAAVVIDATHQQRQERTLRAIERAGYELVRLDAESARTQSVPDRLKLLENRILQYSRDVLHYEHFAILLKEETTGRLDWLVGQDLEEIHGRDFFAGTEGNGICGYVAATGQSYICSDTRHDARYIPGTEGARSSLTVPLVFHDRIIGVLDVESRIPSAFVDEDRQFAELFAHYVAMALHVLNLLVDEHSSASTKVVGSLNAGMAGPLSDIITDATELMEDYIGHDDLRHRLGKMIDRATQVRQLCQRYADAPRAGILQSLKEDNPEESTDPLLEGRRILVADDEALIRDTVRDVLVARGAEVALAADGTEAIRLLEQRQRFDLVISDIRMPGASGYDVFETARKTSPDTAVIFVTGFGYDPNHTLVRVSREGLSAVLYKPFKVEDLIDLCRNALSPKDG